MEEDGRWADGGSLEHVLAAERRRVEVLLADVLVELRYFQEAVSQVCPSYFQLSIIVLITFCYIFLCALLVIFPLLISEI